LCHGVSQIGYVVGKVGGFTGAAFRVVFAQPNSWSDGDFGKGRTQAWMARFLVAVFERSWGLGELSALVGELLCHGELSCVQAQRRPKDGEMLDDEEENDMKYVQVQEEGEGKLK
jgi:hypothetical protein